MKYKPQLRMTHCDISVTRWTDLCDDVFDTPEEAYGEICRYVKGVPDRVGFTDAPERGRIRTGIGYGESSLFEDPQFHNCQFRVVDVVELETREFEPCRMIMLE
jgi:hypothetical protein